MTERRDSDLAKQLWAIGDPARLRILRLLSPTEDCEHGNNVSALAERLGLAQPTISHHLRVLRQAGLVSYRKMCRDVYYWVDAAATAAVLGQLKDVFTETPSNAAKPRARRRRG